MFAREDGASNLSWREVTRCKHLGQLQQSSQCSQISHMYVLQALHFVTFVSDM